MKWKLWLEIIGMATALAALLGVFGILLNVFFHGEYMAPGSAVTIREPSLFILIAEIALVALAIPIMIYIGIKDIHNLVKIEKRITKSKDSEGIKKELRKSEEALEERTGSIFLRTMIVGIALAFMVGLIIYVDELYYQNQRLSNNLNKMTAEKDVLDTQVKLLQEEIIKKDRLIDEQSAILDDIGDSYHDMNRTIKHLQDENRYLMDAILNSGRRD